MDLYSAVVIMNMMLIQCEAIGQDLIRFNKSNLISQTKESGAVYRGPSRPQPTLEEQPTLWSTYNDIHETQKSLRVRPTLQHRYNFGRAVEIHDREVDNSRQYFVRMGENLLKVRGMNISLIIIYLLRRT